MIPNELFDYILTMKTLNIKELLRFAVQFSRKFKKKLFLYRAGNVVITFFRRMISKKYMLITAWTEARLGSLLTKNVLAYSFRKNKIIKKEQTEAWKFIILKTEVSERLTGKLNEPSNIFTEKRFLESNTKQNVDSIVKKIYVRDFSDLVELAYLFRDVIFHLELNERRVFLTGILSYLIQKDDPALFIFCNMDYELPPNVAFIVLQNSSDLKFVQKLSLKDMKFVPIIKLEKIELCSAEKQIIKFRKKESTR